jgi:hypothetical protein
MTNTLTYADNTYSLDDLSDEIKQVVRGLQVAEAQLQMYQDTLGVLQVGRQTLALQLEELLKDVEPTEEQSDDS